MLITRVPIFGRMFNKLYEKNNLNIILGMCNNYLQIVLR